MARAEFRNGPNLNGWVLGAAAGFLALCVSIVVGQFGFMTAAFIAAMVALAVGLILGMPWGADSAPFIQRPASAVTPLDAVVTPAKSEAAPATLVSAESVSAPLSDATALKPTGLPSPRGGVADNLKEIEGIGPVLENLCHELGYFHFDQIAGWTEAEIAWLDQNLKGFRGRVTRDKWVAQARIIVTEGLDAFRVRAKTNDY